MFLALKRVFLAALLLALGLVASVENASAGPLTWGSTAPTDGAPT